MSPLTEDTQAILLLTAPLLTGKKSPSATKPLSLAEYIALAEVLRSRGSTPAALLGAYADAFIDEYARNDNERERVHALLSRGFALAQARDVWMSRSIWVMSRADAAYPRRLKSRLGKNAPPVLYGCGDKQLLQGGGVAVVGSRDADDDALRFAQVVGRVTHEAGMSVVSGGARGVDQAAVSACTDAGGSAVVVLADTLAKASVSAAYRSALRAGRVLLVSPYDPSASFNVGNAMQRNKFIYAFADIGVVASSSLERCGAWAGAVEQLEKLHFVPMFTRASDNDALVALRRMGARALPEDMTPSSMEALVHEAAACASSHPMVQKSFAL